MWEINQKIAEIKGAAPTMDDMPPEDRPEVGAQGISGISTQTAHPAHPLHCISCLRKPCVTHSMLI